MNINEAQSCYSNIKLFHPIAIMYKRNLASNPQLNFINPITQAHARPQESRCIGVFGLSGRTSETDVRHIFSKYGYIEKIILIMDNRVSSNRISVVVVVVVVSVLNILLYGVL